MTTRLMNLVCKDQNEPGSDEPYLKINGTDYFFTNVDDGESRGLGPQDANGNHLGLVVNTGSTVELWEKDGDAFNDHDLIGSFIVDGNGYEPSPVDLHGSGAHYELHYYDII